MLQSGIYHFNLRQFQEESFFDIFVSINALVGFLESFKLKSYSMLMVQKALFISKYDPLSGPAVRQIRF